MPRYSVGLYNMEVRRAMAEGQRHRDLSDDWADIHYIETNAANRAEAWEKVQRRYPVERGYVITDVFEER